jgi:hypothetical protein
MIDLQQPKHRPARGPRDACRFCTRAFRSPPALAPGGDPKDGA